MLEQPDLRTHQFLDLIYGAAVDPERWPAVLQELGRAFHAHTILYMQNLQSGATDLGMMRFTGFEDSALLAYAEHYGKLGMNPWLPRMQRIGVGQIITEEGVFGGDPAIYDSTEYHHDWLKPQRLYSALGCILVRDAGLTTTLSLNRYADAGAAQPEELDLFATLIPHLRRAAQIHREFALSKVTARLGREGLERLGIAAFVVDARAHILFANRVGVGLVRTGEALSARENRLRGLTSQATEALRRLIEEASMVGAGRGSGPGGVVSLPRPFGRPFTALVAPISNSAFASDFVSPAALVLVRDPEHLAIKRPELLQALFNLTRSEAHVAGMLADGIILHAQAELSGTSIHTLRNHLKRAMAKLSARSQSDLVLIVQRSIATLGNGSSTQE